MKLSLAIAALVLSCAGYTFAQDQFPAVFGEPSWVVVGTQKIETLSTWATGKWSDAEEKLGVMSAEIHCYKKLSFCEETEAIVVIGPAQVKMTELDILRWDDSELIAIDSAPTCQVNTVRFDFRTKQVSHSVASKGSSSGLSNQGWCGFVKPTTKLLGGGSKYEPLKTTPK